MTYLADTELRPLGSRDALEQAVYSLLAHLGQQGHLWGGPQVVWAQDTLYVTCQVPFADSLEAPHVGSEVQRSLRQLGAVAANPISWTLRGSNGSNRNTPVSWDACPSFFLMTNLLEQRSPLVAGDDGEAVPLYLLPLAASLRERLTFWMRAYNAHDQIWFDSRDLELAAYSQLANVDSELCRRGQSICADVEAATSRPTYFYLHCHYARSPIHVEVCPACSKGWVVASPSNPPGLASFPLRCDPCRLVSIHGPVASNVDHNDAQSPIDVG